MGKGGDAIGRDIHRRRFLASGLAGVGSLGLAPAAFAQQEPAGPPATDSLNATVDAWGRPTARVMLDGKGPFRFRVDTGANGSVVSAEVIAALGLPIVGERLVHGTTGTAKLAFATVGRLAAGPVRRRNLDVSIAPPGALMRTDGILGADIFAGQRLVFDMRARQVELFDSSSVRFRDPPPRNMYLRNGMLAEVGGTVGDIPVRFMLDTGADACIVNAPLNARLRRSGLDPRRFGPGTIIGVTGHQITGEFVALPTVRFAGLTLGDALAVAANVPIFDLWGLQADPAMIVGVDVFSKLSLCVFDYTRKRFDAFVQAPEGIIAHGGPVEAV